MEKQITKLDDDKILVIENVEVKRVISRKVLEDELIRLNKNIEMIKKQLSDFENAKSQ